MLYKERLLSTNQNFGCLWYVPCFLIIIANLGLKNLGVLAFSIMQAKQLWILEIWRMFVLIHLNYLFLSI